MKIIKHASKSKKIILLILAVVLLSALAYGVYAKQSNRWPFIQTPHTNSDKGRDIDYKSPTNDQKSEGERIKERSVDQPSQTTPPPSSTTQKKNVAATVTSANQNNGKFQVRFLIQALDKGSCVLRLTKGTTSVTKTSATQTLPNSMTCQGFDIPLSELSSGEWTYTMTFTGNDTNATVTDKVNIQ
jgi:hypothetical protein